MDENGSNNILAEVLGSLVNNRGDGERNYGNNWMWVIFFVFMMCWGGNGFGGFGGFGNRGFLGPGTNLATQGDVAATAAWGQTQDAIRDTIENTTNNISRLAQDVNAGHNRLAQDIGGVNQNISQLGYNQLAQANATNQQLAKTGFDLQTAIMAGNNLLQGAIMGGNNMLNSAIRETAGDTKLAICQGNSALQAIVQGTGNNIQNAIYQTANETQRQIQGTGANLGMAILQSGNETQRQIQGTGFGIQNAICQSGNATQAAIFQTANATQRDIQSTSCETQREIQAMNGENRLAICQATNALQGAVNDNGNRIVNGITGLGFLTQQKGDEIKFEMAKATNAITANETANTQKVLDKLCMMEANMQASKIQELQIANQALMLSNQVKEIQAGQIASTGYIINQIRPYPVPAYTVSSPYGTSTTTPTTTG